MPPYVCRRCGDKKRDKTALKYHVSRKIQCPARFEDVDSATYLDDLGYEEEIYLCRHCGGVFVSENTQKRHYETCKALKMKRKAMRKPQYWAGKRMKFYQLGENPIESIIGDFDIPTETDGPGIYLFAVGIWQGKVLLKFGWTDNIRARMKAHTRRFETLEEPDFTPFAQLVYWRSCENEAQAREMERRVKAAVLLEDLWMGKDFQFGEYQHRELFVLKTAEDKDLLWAYWNRIWRENKA